MLNKIANAQFLGVAAVMMSLATAEFASGATIKNFTINTSGVNGTPGKLAFDITTSNPGTSGNHVSIQNFAAPGATTGLPDTQGGLVSGDLILHAPPATLTTIDTDSFFNELTVNFTKFSNSITFTLQLTENPPPGGGPPDEFALFLLNSSGLPPFPTSDPLGANALITIDITGAAGGLVNVFSPAVAGANNSVSVVVPGGVEVVPEPAPVALVSAGLLLLIVSRARKGTARG